MTEPRAPRWTALIIALAGVMFLVVGWIGRPLLLGMGVLGVLLVALGGYWWRQR
jgi:hypothetical protein